MKLFIRTLILVLLLCGSAQGGIIADMIMNSGPRLVWQGLTYDPTTYEMELQSRGVGTPTLTRTTTQYVLDHENIYRSAAANNPAWYGGRKVENLLLYSQDLSNASWVKIGTASVTGTNILNMPAVNDGITQTRSTTGSSGSTYVARIAASGAGTVEFTLYTVGTGDATFYTATLSGSTTTWSVPLSVTGNITGVVLRIRRVVATTATQVTIASTQVENSTGRTDTTTPSEYVATTSAAVTKWYANSNGNTVASNVITEATGSILATIPSLQVDPALTNSLFNSRDLTGWTQSGTSVSAYNAVGLTGAANTATTLTDDDAAVYESVQRLSIIVPSDSNYNTFVFYVKKDTDTSRYPGAEFHLIGGTVVKTGVIINTSTGAITGILSTLGTTATSIESSGLFWKVYISLLNNSSGNTEANIYLYPAVSLNGTSASIAATGSCIVGNAELYLNKTIAQVRGAGPIFTTTAAVTTGAQTLAYNLANHSNNKGAYYAFISPSFGTATINGNFLGTSASSVAFFAPHAAGILAYDGTTIMYSTPATWTAGDNIPMGLVYAMGQMNINNTGNWKGDVAYDGGWEADLGGIQVGFNTGGSFKIRDLRRYHDGTYNQLKATIDGLMP